jgi:hypothetical protein
MLEASSNKRLKVMKTQLGAYEWLAEETCNGEKEGWRAPKEDSKNVGETYHPKESFKVLDKLDFEKFPL